LVELIGVLAIMGILASMTVPPILRQIRQAQSGNEEANLNEVARAIVEGIKATGKIPNPNITPFGAGGWADVAYNYTTLTSDAAGPGTLHYVFPKEVNYEPTARRIYLDNILMAYLKIATGSPDAAEIPFTTPAGGWPAVTTSIPPITFPNQALLLYIVSSSRPDFELSCRVNQVNLQVALNNYGEVPAPGLITSLRNWVKAVNQATGFIYAPDALVENWNDLGHQYLHVKTVDLRPLFCKVTLIDTAAPEDITNFKVATAGTGYTPSATVMVSYLNNNITFQTLPADLFTDVNLNGIYDIGEPYIDINGDGAYNATGAINTTIIPTLNLASTYNAQHGKILNTAIPPGTADYETPPSPNPPTYDLYATALPTAGDFLPSPDPTPPAGLGADHNQTQVFYVLKGQSINLFDGAGALNKSIVIQSDVQYRYFNNTWIPVD
jgi:type II secretory pathway pseudopilin PulG